MKGYYKVPFRHVQCATLRLWLASVIRSFVVYKLDPPTFTGQIPTGEPK